MQDIEQLLKDVAFKMGTLREARNRFSAQLAPDFRIFDYLRTDEMGLSRCIASLLDPNGAHGQGRVFLAAFLKKIGPTSDWATTSDDCKVITEKQANGQRRIDIYLDFKNSGIIGIENKPWAGDQTNQLYDYADFIKNQAGNKKWLLIYLSNSDPTVESIALSERETLEEFGQFVRLTYANIIGWLEDCACQSRSLVVRVFIEELAKFIRMNVNGELDMSEKIEMKNVILKSTENLKSAFQISMAIDGVKQDLLAVFEEDLKRNLNAEGFDLTWDPSMSKGWKSFAGFGVKFSKEHNFNLRFEFDSAGLHDLYWGICRESDAIKNDADIWNAVNVEMNNQFYPGRKTEWWPWWNWIDTNQEFEAGFRHWDKGEIPWVSMKDGTLAEKITVLAVRVHNAFSNANRLHLLHGGYI